MAQLLFMTNELLHLNYTLTTIDDAVSRFWAVLGGNKIFAFSGSMGAGKTTFISRLCSYLAVSDAVSSPTFALINEYHFETPGNTDNTIYHMDWYRLRSVDEAVNAGVEDCLNEARKRDKVYCFVEWPENAPELLTGPHLWISIDLVDEGARIMTVGSRK